MLNFWRTLLVLSLPLSIFAEAVSWNLGLISNIGRGEQVGADYDYLENFVNASAESGPWYLDLRFEYSTPPEYGFENKALERAWLRYSSDSWTLELGDISAVFGRGLSLNLYEDQSIDFDNQVRGVWFNTSLFGEHELDFLIGRNEVFQFYSPSSDLREPDGRASYGLGGLELNINAPSGNWYVAPYLIGSRLESDYNWSEIDPSYGGLVTDTVSQTMHAIQAGWGQSVYGENWDMYLEYNNTWRAFDYPLLEQRFFQTDEGVTLQTISQDYRTQGQAFNIQVNWFPEWFTAMFEYKRYLNGPESTADKRNPLLQAGKPLPWQIGPTGIRQHDISLLGNVTHPVDYGDELGWNLELRRMLSNNWSLTLNASHTSQARDSRDLDGSQGYIPSSEISQNPWREYFSELEYSGDVLSQRMFLAYTRSVLSGASAAEIMEHYTLVPAYLSWHPTDNLVLSTVIELQQSKVKGEVYDGAEIPGHSYRSAHLIGSLDIRHKYSGSIIWDQSDDPLLNTGDHKTQNWVSGEISVKPLDGLWVRASYGKEKGGVRCTGGVCRVLNPFEGFRMSVEWRL